MVVNVIGKVVEFMGISYLKLRMLCIYNYVHIFEKGNELLVGLNCGHLENYVNLDNGVG